MLDRLYESAVTPGRWREMSAFPLHDDRGRLASVLTIGLDVTDRERAQAALRESERRLAEFVRKLPGTAYRLRHMGHPEDERAPRHFEFMSEGCTDLFGYTPEQVIEQSLTLWALAHPDDRKAWSDELIAAYREGRALDHRLRVIRSDGSVRWVLHRARVVERTGEGLVTEGLIVDIDAQARAEADLVRRQNLLQTVTDTLPRTGISMCDAAGRYQFINEFAARSHEPGWTAANFIGKRREELGSGRAVQMPARIHDEVVSSGQPILGREYESETNPGQWRQLHAAPVVGADGSTEGVVQVHVDITRLKQVEHALQEHRDRLEDLVAERTAALSQEIADRERAEQALARNERLAAIGQLAATVSHELRNPLGTIRTSLILLDEGSGPRSPAQQRARRRIERNIDRCVHIIEQMLDFTRSRTIDFRPTDIDRWCHEVIADAAIPEEVTLSLDLGCAEDVPIDRERMRQILLNLLQNAWQAVVDGPAGGPLAVGVRTRIDGDALELAVSDSGTGIAAENLERVFEPLFSTRSFGVGLGLPLVKRLVEEHGGEIHVDSRPGHGTTVRVRIPRRPVEG